MFGNQLICLICTGNSQLINKIVHNSLDNKFICCFKIGVEKIQSLESSESDRKSSEKCQKRSHTCMYLYKNKENITR